MPRAARFTDLCVEYTGPQHVEYVQSNCFCVLPTTVYMHQLESCHESSHAHSTPVTPVFRSFVSILYRCKVPGMYHTIHTITRSIVLSYFTTRSTKLCAVADAPPTDFIVENPSNWSRTIASYEAVCMLKFWVAPFTYRIYNI